MGEEEDKNAEEMHRKKLVNAMFAKNTPLWKLEEDAKEELIDELVEEQLSNERAHQVAIDKAGDLVEGETDIESYLSMNINTPDGFEDRQVPLNGGDLVTLEEQKELDIADKREQFAVK